LVLWGGCAFVLAWFVARRYITPPRRALAVSAAVAAAFVLGGLSPFSLRGAGDAPVTTAASAREAQAVAGPASSEAQFPPAVQPLAMCPASLHVTSLSGHGMIDGVNVFTGDIPVDRGTTPFVEPSDRLVVNGWATDDTQSAPAKGICAVLDGRVVANADIVYGHARPDVAAALGRPRLRASGFEVGLSAAVLPKGKHTLSIATISADGKHASMFGGMHPVEVR
jgi:hypothetical protein